MKNGQFSKFTSLLGCTASERATLCIKKINHLVEFLQEAINQSFGDISADEDDLSTEMDDIEYLTIGELKDIVSKFPQEG